MATNFAWSYSRLSSHEKCAHRYGHQYVWKTPFIDEAGPPLIHGRRVHGGMAAYLLGGENGTFYAEQDKITYKAEMRLEAKKIGHFSALIEDVRANQPVVEQQWGYTELYRPTSWFGKDTYWRVILDAGVLWPDNKFSCIDWKTGRAYEDNADQMRQFAVGVFSRYPQVHWLETRLEYLDTGQEQHEEFRRSDVPSLVADFARRVGPIENDKTFAPRPGSHCRFCPFRKNGGTGHCEFS